MTKIQHGSEQSQPPQPNDNQRLSKNRSKGACSTVHVNEVTSQRIPTRNIYHVTNTTQYM
eukprot:m.162279 g.162279  ORF g.162279 m.162279 type:complete len:60 (-) comp14373_c0_seq1:58-237(-)